MRGGLSVSVLFHATVATVAYVGIPYLKPEPAIIETPIYVDVVNITEVSNPPPPEPVTKPEPEKAEEPPPPPEPPKVEAPSPPPEPEPVVEAPPEPEPEPEPAPKEEVAALPPEPEPELVPEPEPKIEPVAEPKVEPKPEPKPKPKAKLSGVRPPRKPKPPDTFASVLKTLEDLKKKAPAKKPPPEAPKEQKPSFEKSIADALRSRPTKRHNRAQPLSMSEIDAVRHQIQRCWNVPAGAKDAENMVIEVAVIMNRDGTVREARVVDANRMRGDAFFRTAAEAARRAVLNPKCNKLKLPAEKFDQWQQMTLNFNPKEMF
ncbi:MAG: energy transducer TonB [Rhodospirillaceae bacterium]|nr:energy transducer TonB [Rhodospirillaceae bacterium]